MQQRGLRELSAKMGTERFGGGRTRKGHTVDDEIRVQHLQCPQQKNGDDCGVHVMEDIKAATLVFFSNEVGLEKAIAGNTSDAMNASRALWAKEIEEDIQEEVTGIRPERYHTSKAAQDTDNAMPNKLFDTTNPQTSESATDRLDTMKTNNSDQDHQQRSHSETGLPSPDKVQPQSNSSSSQPSKPLSSI